MRAAIDEQGRRFERLVDERFADAARPTASTASTTTDAAVTIDDLEHAIETLRDAIDSGRREDVDFILAEIAAAEMRSGAALDATRERLRYYALAENPGATEW